MSSSVLVWRIVAGVVDGHVQTNNSSCEGSLRWGFDLRESSGYLLQDQVESSMYKESLRDLNLRFPTITSVRSTPHGLTLQTTVIALLLTKCFGERLQQSLVEKHNQ